MCTGFRLIFSDESYHHGNSATTKSWPAMSDASMDVAPAAAVVAATLASAWPTYAIMLRAKSGRARSAIAYLLGFAAGLAGTAFMAAATVAAMADGTAVVGAGLLASFVAPLVGMVHAKLHGPPRRRSRVSGAGSQVLGVRE
jgi:hypothetical protein